MIRGKLNQTKKVVGGKKLLVKVKGGQVETDSTTHTTLVSDHSKIQVHKEEL